MRREFVLDGALIHVDDAEPDRKVRAGDITINPDATVAALCEAVDDAKNLTHPCLTPPLLEPAHLSVPVVGSIE